MPGHHGDDKRAAIKEVEGVKARRDPVAWSVSSLPEHVATHLGGPGGAGEPQGDVDATGVGEGSPCVDVGALSQGPEVDGVVFGSGEGAASDGADQCGEVDLEKKHEAKEALGLLGVGGLGDADIAGPGQVLLAGEHSGLEGKGGADQGQLCRQAGLQDSLDAHDAVLPPLLGEHLLLLRVAEVRVKGGGGVVSGDGVYPW